MHQSWGSLCCDVTSEREKESEWIRDRVYSSTREISFPGSTRYLPPLNILTGCPQSFTVAAHRDIHSGCLCAGWPLALPITQHYYLGLGLIAETRAPKKIMRFQYESPKQAIAQIDIISLSSFYYFQKTKFVLLQYLQLILILTVYYPKFNYLNYHLKS